MEVLLYVSIAIVLLIVAAFFIFKVINIFVFRQLTISKIDSITGKDFEDVAAIIFKKHGYSITKTKASNDYGADLIIKKHGKTIVVQCKLYYNHKVGASSVQEAHSAKGFYSATGALVFSNWTFSNQAKTLATTLGVVLIDRHDLQTTILQLQKGKKHNKIKNLYKNIF